MTLDAMCLLQLDLAPVKVDNDPVWEKSQLQHKRSGQDFADQVGLGSCVCSGDKCMLYGTIPDTRTHTGLGT